MSSKVRRSWSCMVFVSSTFVIASCARYHVEYIPLGPDGAAGVCAPSQVTIIYDEKPRQPVRDVGRIEADSSGNGNYVPDTPRAMEMLKEEAAKHAACAVHSVVCGKPGTVGDGKCSGIAYVPTG